MRREDRRNLRRGVVRIHDGQCERGDEAMRERVSLSIERAHRERLAQLLNRCRYTQSSRIREQTDLLRRYLSVFRCRLHLTKRDQASSDGCAMQVFVCKG